MEAANKWRGLLMPKTIRSNYFAYGCLTLSGLLQLKKLEHTLTCP
jgi:hypothetical protein